MGFERRVKEAMADLSEFFDKFKIKDSKVLDVGSAGMQSYGYKHTITKEYNCSYVGLDIKEAKNVDVILTEDNLYKWPFKDNTFDAVVSGQCLEHVEFFWLAFKEMIRVVKENGYIYLRVPSAGIHHTPPDYWRFNVDSMRALANWGEVELVHRHLDKSDNDVCYWGFHTGYFKKTQPLKGGEK